MVEKARSEPWAYEHMHSIVVFYDAVYYYRMDRDIVLLVFLSFFVSYLVIIFYI